MASGTNQGCFSSYFNWVSGRSAQGTQSAYCTCSKCINKQTCRTCQYSLALASGLSSLNGPAGIFHPEAYQANQVVGCFMGTHICHPASHWGWGSHFTDHPINIGLGVFAALSSALTKAKAAPTSPENSWQNCKNSCTCYNTSLLLAAAISGLSSGGLSWVGLSGLLHQVPAAKVLVGLLSGANCIASAWLGHHSADKFIEHCRDIKDHPKQQLVFCGALGWGIAAVSGKTFLTYDVLAHFLNGYLAAAAGIAVLSNVTGALLLSVAIYKLFSEVYPKIRDKIAQEGWSPSLVVLIIVSTIFAVVGCLDYGGSTTIALAQINAVTTAQVMGLILAIPRGALVFENLFSLGDKIVSRQPSPEAEPLLDRDPRVVITTQPGPYDESIN